MNLKFYFNNMLSLLYIHFQVYQLPYCSNSQFFIYNITVALYW